MENDTKYTYEIFDDGYDILVDGAVSYTQRDPYSRLFKPDGTYEENAELHIESIENQPEPQPEQPSLEEINRADIDYLALMTDVTLPDHDNTTF